MIKLEIFYDENRLYLLIEYATRGDLYSHLKRSKGFDEKTVKNYRQLFLLYSVIDSESQNRTISRKRFFLQIKKSSKIS